MTPQERPRGAHRNVALPDLLSYLREFPATAWVSLMHRISGAILFILLPAILWMFDNSVSSELSFARFVNVFDGGFWLIPAWMVKLATLVVLWSYLHHLIAGVRFLMLDVSHAALEKARARRSAQWVLVLSLGLTLGLGAKLFGLY